MYKLLITIGCCLLVSYSATAVAQPPTPKPEADQKSSLPIATASAYLQHCGICHLDAGQGVPGAFPPLGQRIASWAKQDAGRKYLTSVVANGLYGVIQVEGQQYAGAMPGLGTQLSNAEIAGLLNYVLVQFSDSNATFSEASVEADLAALGSGPSLVLRPDK